MKNQLNLVAPLDCDSNLDLDCMLIRFDKECNQSLVQGFQKLDDFDQFKHLQVVFDSKA